MNGRDINRTIQSASDHSNDIDCARGLPDYRCRGHGHVGDGAIRGNDYAFRISRQGEVHRIGLGSIVDDRELVVGRPVVVVSAENDCLGSIRGHYHHSGRIAGAYRGKPGGVHVSLGIDDVKARGRSTGTDAV